MGLVFRHLIAYPICSKNHSLFSSAAYLIDSYPVSFLSVALYIFLIHFLYPTVAGMAALTLFLVGTLLIILTLWKRINRRDKIPHGLKKLPGPKGMVSLPTQIINSRHVVLLPVTPQRLPCLLAMTVTETFL